MKEVCDAVQSGRLVEMFGSGDYFYHHYLLSTSSVHSGLT
jgi:hypothetical protein